MTEITDDYLTGCEIEKEDFRNFGVSDWGDEEIIETPEEVNNLDKATLLRQSGVTCTAQGITNVLEIEVFRVYKQKVSIDADWQWANQSKIPSPTKTVNGDRLTSAIKAAMMFGVKIKEVHTKGQLKKGDIIHLKGYAKVNKDINSIKQQLARGKGIYTACSTTMPREKGKENWTTWTYARNEGFINLKGTHVGGHAWTMGGYDKRNNTKDGNSYGETWGHYKDGSFMNYEEQLTSLATMYVFYLKEDKKISSADKARAIRTMKIFWKLSEILKGKEGVNALIGDELRTIQEISHDSAEIIRNLD